MSNPTGASGGKLHERLAEIEWEKPCHKSLNRAGRAELFQPQIKLAFLLHVAQSRLHTTAITIKHRSITNFVLVSSRSQPQHIDHFLVIYLYTRWKRPNPTMQRCMMHADDSRALVHKSSTISSRVRIVRRHAPNSRPFSDACDVVDRDEVDRLRKRFMKLDKVRRDALAGIRTPTYPFP
jgi:hypothetical protein